MGGSAGKGQLNRLIGWILLVALAILCGCLGGSSRGPTGGDPIASAPGEDAGPTYHEEDEVEIRARPVDPIRPAYPPRLRALGIEGDVVARVIVLSDGSVAGGELVEAAHDDFAAAVRAALRGARFHPARLHGEPVSSWVTLKLHFRIGE